MNLFRLAIALIAFTLLPLGADALPEDVQSRLNEAEERLRLAEATEKRISERLEAMEADPESQEAALEAMRRYLEEVQELVTMHRDTVQELQQLAGSGSPAPGAEITEGMRALEEAIGRLPEPEEPEDELARLDREFAASLEAFDEKIADHMEQVRLAMDARMSETTEQAKAPAQAAAEAAALLREMGVDPGVEAPESTPNSGPPPSGGGEHNRPPSGEGEKAGQEPNEEGGSDRRAREDEDIVARQLREAAEQEKDPELREKLWKEYEAYLDGRG